MRRADMTNIAPDGALPPSLRIDADTRRVSLDARDPAFFQDPIPSSRRSAR